MWFIAFISLSTFINYAVSHVHTPHQVTCSNLFIFGDGFSDDGAEDDVISHGFQRNSNGPVWGEYTRNKLDCNNYINYAYSGAKSNYDNFYFKNWSGIHWQIEQFTSSRKKMDKDSLIIFQVGGIVDLLSGEVEAGEIVTNFKVGLDLLFDYVNEGRIIIMNLIDISSSPGFNSTAINEKENPEMLSFDIASINQKIRNIATLALNKLNKHVVIKVFDLNSSSFRRLSSLNTTKPFTYQSISTTSLTTTEFGYFDTWHPTTIVHSRIADDLIEFLEDG